MKKQIDFQRVLILFFILYSVAIIPASAQFSIQQLTASGHEQKRIYTQDFNSLPASGNWTNGSTLSGWYATPLSGTQQTQITANNGTLGGVGLYSFGSTDDTDRALGGHGANGWGGYYYAIRFKNDSGSTIKHLKVSFAVEQWYTIKQSSSSFGFAYAIGTSVNGPTAAVTWNPVDALAVTVKAAVPQGSGNSSRIDGNISSNRAQVNYLMSDVNLAPGQEIILRWDQKDVIGVTGNGEFPSSALDDVQVEFIQNDVFYAIGKNLNHLNNWTTDGTNAGINPTNFTELGQVFVVATAGNYKLNSNLAISGVNSKLILGEGTDSVAFSVPFKYELKATVDIANKATLIVNHESKAPTFGNLASNSNVIYTDSTTAPISGVYGNLFITGGKQKTITSEVQVKGRLWLNETGVLLQNSTITLTDGASIKPVGDVAFIKTGPGASIKQYLQPNNSRFFPVGSETGYAPVSVALSAGKAARYVSVNVADGVYVHYDSDNKGIGEAIKSELVNKVWLINQEGATTPDASVTFYWNGTDELTNFDRSLAELAYYNNTEWQAAGATVNTYSTSARLAATTPTNSITQPNIKSGMYAVWQPPRGPLPVELTTFTATYKNGQTLLNWTTASEHNSDYFAIETSTDGKHFSEIGQVKAAGFSSVVTDYTYTHYPAGVGVVYYRLIEYDENGDKMYSKIVSINAKQEGPQAISVYPNPSRGKLYLVSATINGNVSLILSDMSGKAILTQQIKVAGGEPTTIDLQQLPEGVYLVQLQSPVSRQVIRLVHLPD